MNLPIITYLMNIWRNSKLKEFENFMHGDNMDEYSLDKAEKIIKYYESMHRIREDGMVESYKAPEGKYTIGWGNTFYEDGTPVQRGDKIDRERAEELLGHTIDKFKEDVLDALKTRVDANQFNALISFTYNVGVGNLKRSTLLRKINKNPKDRTTPKEFLRWNKARVDGTLKPLRGLTRRRMTEKILYETGDIVFPSTDDI